MREMKQVYTLCEGRRSKALAKGEVSHRSLFVHFQPQKLMKIHFLHEGFK